MALPGGYGLPVGAAGWAGLAGALPKGLGGACALDCAAANGFGAAPPPPPPACWPPVAKGFPAGVVEVPLAKGFELGVADGCPKGLAALFCTGVALPNGFGAG